MKIHYHKRKGKKKKILNNLICGIFDDIRNTICLKVKVENPPS